MADLRQQPQRSTNAGKKKGGGWGTIIVLLLIFVLPRLMEAVDSSDFRRVIQRMRFWLLRNHIDPQLLPLLIVIAIVFVVGLIVVFSAASKKREKIADSGRVRTNTTAGRTSAATRRPDPRNRSFTPPEPSCIVCDHTGEDHFLRDKAQRIAQLDEWLKNGLIDRNEYRVLKDRYERDL